MRITFCNVTTMTALLYAVMEFWQRCNIADSRTGTRRRKSAVSKLGEKLLFQFCCALGANHPFAQSKIEVSFLYLPGLAESADGQVIPLPEYAHNIVFLVFK